ncbi:MAG: precorrin-6B C5,15-methyltransferase / cobalt-precorrin-6B C5,C15-methyltransferase [Methylobacteriaceae bacterium]|jgi:precorrin-6Y C5,15-methyltransferase (decarboxylating)|nr:precorrin-6B C5,15-methyltransferase / cobalt-precorrin-6B C5,C15-methyltransferase [Methylobacteriaceae bacterium]
MSGATQKWLALVGIGEDGVDGLSPRARRLIADAEFIIGGARHLKLAGSPKCESLVWPSPISEAIAPILARRGQRVVVLASGDPFFFGVGSIIAAHLPIDEIISLPAPSAFSLAASRLGWSLQDCILLSLHGRSFERIVPHLQPRTRILVLAWDETTAPRVATCLEAHHMGGSRITVLEALGGPREKVRSIRADAFDMPGIGPLNVVAIEVAADPEARAIPLSRGLPDSYFEHDGQITKREIRAVTIAALAPRRGELLWDIGAGSGSIAIEWMLCDPTNTAIAIEERADRAARIARNAGALGVPGLRIVTAQAPAGFAELPPPDAIFIGGGANDHDVIDQACAALSTGGRLVVNAVTLETQALLYGRFKEQGGELVQMQVAHAEPVGTFSGWRPAMPVVQWRVTKR